jgi:CRISPR-associated protein Csm2
MQNPPRPGQQQGPRGGHDRGGGRPQGGGRFGKTDDDFRGSIREFFGNDYVARILDSRQGDYNEFIDRVKRFVQLRLSRITTSQLRNIFPRVKAARSPQDLFMLRPQLAYVAGRSEKEEMRELVVLLDDLIREVTEARMESFKSFFEAVIAYHKYYNPRES